MFSYVITDCLLSSWVKGIKGETGTRGMDGAPGFNGTEGPPGSMVGYVYT